MPDPYTEGDARTSTHARACRDKMCEMSCQCWCHGIDRHLAGGLRPDTMQRCECGHILQRVGEDRLLRCGMGCSYQAKRDADDDSPEDRMVVLRRHPDGTPSVWCDPEIADIVQALNAGGVPTVASCSGHGNHPGNIALTDGRELIIADEQRKIDEHSRAVEAGTAVLASIVWGNDQFKTIIEHDPAGNTVEYESRAREAVKKVLNAALNSDEMFLNEEYPDDINESYWRERAHKGWERVRALESALPDPDNLEILADWFDARDAPGSSDEVQRDLREWARRARVVMEESDVE